MASEDCELIFFSFFVQGTIFYLDFSLLIVDIVSQYLTWNNNVCNSYKLIMRDCLLGWKGLLVLALVLLLHRMRVLPELNEYVPKQ